MTPRAGLAVICLMIAAVTLSANVADAAAPPSNAYTSPSAMRDWLESLSWSTNPYSAGQEVSNYKYIIRDTATQDVINELFAFLSETQNQNTGFWGGGNKYQQLSGAFKLTEVYRVLGRTLPHATELYDSTVDAVLTTDSTSIVNTIAVNGNPIRLFNYIEDNGLFQRTVPDSERLAIITKTINNLKKFQKSNGGLSGYPDRAIDRYWGGTVGLEVGKGLVEGDIYGSYHVMGDYNRLYSYSKLPLVPIDGSPYIQELENPGSQTLDPMSESINPSTKQEAMGELQSMFRNIFIFMGGLYDPDTGGFFAEYSSKTDPERYAPILSITGQAIIMLNYGGVIDDLPASMVCKIHDYYEARWDSSDQLYYDIAPHEIMRTSQQQINYANNYANSYKSILGPRPAYCSGCVSNDSFMCYNGDSYWYDSCGNMEGKKEECGTKSCTGGRCVTQGCLAGNTSWANKGIERQTGTFTVEFNATPLQEGMDGVTALAESSGSGYDDYAVLVRFNQSGYIEARNGDAYQSDAIIPYVQGKSYHFRVETDVPDHLYSVYVTPDGGSEQSLATGYVFRTQQNSVTELGYWGLISGIGSHEVCDFRVVDDQNAYPDTHYAEAESGEIVFPMTNGTNSDASGGKYVYTPTNSDGSANFTFDIQRSGKYWIEARVNSHNSLNENSFFVGLDGKDVSGDSKHVYDIVLTGDFVWDDVSLRGPNGNENISDFDPMAWDLSAGKHTFTFYGRERDAWLDSVAIKRFSDADTDLNKCVIQKEIMDFINHWYLDSTTYPMGELMEAVGLWKTGTECPGS